MKGQGIGKVKVMKGGTVVSMEIHQLWTVLQHHRDDAVLHHLSELHVLQALEAGSRHLPRDVVGGIAHGGGGLQAVLELNGEHLKSVTVVENLGNVKLWHVHYWIGLLMNDELQADLFQILSAPTVFKVMNDGREHSLRISNPDESDVLEMRKVGEIIDVEEWLPAGERPDVGEDVDKVVHARVGDLPRVERYQGEGVHVEGGDDAQGAQEGVGDGVLSEAAQARDLPAKLLQANIGDAGVSDVNMPER